MNNPEQRIATVGAMAGLALVAAFFAWAELDPASLHANTLEDGPIENATAALFGLSSLLFVLFAYRSEFLKGKGRSIYFMTVGWALLMFIFTGEEISWGQRIFDITTPEALKQINVQEETNIHNLVYINTFMGGKYRYLSIMMLTTGLLLPLFAMTRYGRQTMQRFAFPVAPLWCAPLFVGAFAYGKYYLPTLGNDSAEVRELLMSAGMAAFALAGVISPCTLFRSCAASAASRDAT